MTDFTFHVSRVRPAPGAAVPTLLFRLHASRARRERERVHAIALRTTVQIDARRRRYDSGEQARLYDVFGPPSLWERSVTPLVWTHAATVVPSFDRDIDFDLPIACTYDFEVVAAKYLHAIRGGEIPLLFLFSGTAFFAGERGFTIQPVSWDTAAAFAMPASGWRDLMDQYYPDSAWIRVSRDTLDALHAHRNRLAAPGWDATLSALLDTAAPGGAV